MGKCRTILLVVTVLFLLGIAWWITEGQTTVDADYTEEIERLKEQNDSLANSNLLLDKEVERLHLQNDSLTLIVQEKRSVIIDLKKVKHEKIKAIDNYSNDKLFRFFAEFETDSTRTER